MNEEKKSWSIPVKSGDLITVHSGTKQILSYMPTAKAGVVVDVTVTEFNEDVKG